MPETNETNVTNTTGETNGNHETLEVNPEARAVLNFLYRQITSICLENHICIRCHARMAVNEHTRCQRCINYSRNRVRDGKVGELLNGV